LLLAIGLVAGSLVACASRPESGFLTPVAITVPTAGEHTMLVATTREKDPRPGTLYNGDRSPTLSYAELTVSVPPDHVAGNIEWATTPPGDPATNFVVRDERYLDDDKAFVSQVNAQLALRPPGSRKIFLFIHGFNTMFAEGLYLQTQIVHDGKAPGVPVLFTWASRGKATAYVYDTNSATAARDSLVHTIRLLLASNAEQVNLLAHSMGNWVTVEALRQIKISGDLDHTNKFGLVVLAAPDIDIDVFKSQMRTFGKPRKPFYILVSNDDRALWLSKTIGGDVTRVGDDPNTAELAALGATVVDLTELKGDDPFNHSKFAELATVAPELRGILTQDANGLRDRTVLGPTATQGALGAIAILPITLLGAPLRIITDQ
jgi:esterase/lipase superfamily enzyme